MKLQSVLVECAQLVFDETPAWVRKETNAGHSNLMFFLFRIEANIGSVALVPCVTFPPTLLGTDDDAFMCVHGCFAVQAPALPFERPFVTEPESEAGAREGRRLSLHHELEHGRRE